MDHRRRLVRAQEHLESIHRSFQTFINGQPNALHTEYDVDRKENIVRFGAVTALPSEWSLVVGDAVHNMRSALDNFAYALARANLGRDPTKSEAITIQFPIFETPEGFKKRGVGYIKLMSPAARAVIEGLQRYRGPDPSAWHPVTLLAELSNVDKHRHLLMSHAVVGTFQMWVRRPGADVPVFHNSSFKGPFEAGTEVFSFPALQGDESGEMDVDHITGVDVAFAPKGPAGGWPVRTLLRDALYFIRDEVFPALEPLL